MDNVPEELATLVGQHKDEAHRAQGKAMHKVVARQQEAQRALSTVREDRQAYEVAWGQCLEQLSTLMETQLQERATTLEKFDASEDAWRKQLEEASAELSKKAAQHLSPSMDVDIQEISDQEIDEREKQVDEAIEEAKQQHNRQAREQTDTKAKDLVKAMKSLREQLPEKQREGSRTPRRAGSKEPGGAETSTGETCTPWSGPYMSRMGLYGPCYYPDINLEGRGGTCHSIYMASDFVDELHAGLFGVQLCLELVFEDLGCPMIRVLVLGAGFGGGWISGV